MLQLRLERGDLWTAPTPLNCSNQLLSVGVSRLRLQVVSLADNTREPDGWRELSAMLDSGVVAKDRADPARAQQQMQMRLHHDQELVSQGLSDFVSSSDRTFSTVFTSTSLASFAWLGGITVLIVSLLLLVWCRVRQRRAALARVALPS